MIRLFVSDLDGTLLNEDHKLDEKIKQAIHKVIESGAYFSVATGRNKASGILEGLENDIYHICMNGAVTVEPKGKIIQKHVIDQKYLIDLMEKFPDIQFHWISEEHAYLRYSKEDHLNEINKGNRRFKPIDEETRETFMRGFVFDATKEEILSHDIVKVNCFIQDPKQTRQLEEYLMKQEALVNAPCDDGMFEITGKGVNKGAAIQELAQSLGIKPEEVAVYGDGGNDLEMLEMFEHSYCPKSGMDIAKEKAHQIIGSCADYGVITHILETLEKQA